MRRFPNYTIRKRRRKRVTENTFGRKMREHHEDMLRKHFPKPK